MRLHPHGRAEHDLDLLAAAQRRDAVVRRELRVEAHVLEVRLDVRRRERPEHARGRLRYFHVDLLAGLVPAPLDELLVAVEVLAIIRIVGRLELDLVVVFFGRLVRLALAGQPLDDPFGFRGLRRIRIGVDEVDDRLLELELGVGDLHRVLGDGLAVLAAGVAPPDVLVRRLVHVLLDVVERVLRDVADARVRVLPDGPRRRLDLAREALDERRLARAVRADARDTRGQRHLDRRLLDGDLVVARVLEGDVDDLDEGLALRLHAFDRPRLREVELEFVRLELEVGARLGPDLHEGREVALEAGQLEVGNFEDVVADVI
mmetsp:Transcript_7992/g.22467  ORF Transcript_7992/g.22467 Transcript_7992/m.22467 type:complete len:318 (-) Transcript_7992:1784-2737(-)